MNGNSISSGAINSSGTISGTVSSTGAVTQPRYLLYVVKNATQAITASTATGVIWDALDTGGNTGFTFSLNDTLITIPVAGRWTITYDIVYVANNTNLRWGWIEINNGGTPSTTHRRYSQAVITAIAGANTCPKGTLQWDFAANDTFQVVTYHTSSTNPLNIAGGDA